MQAHDYKMNNFWIYYLLAVFIAILGTLWMVAGNALVYEALYGEPMLPDAYTFVGMMMQQAEARLGLLSDSILPAIMIHGASNYLGGSVDGTKVIFVFSTQSLMTIAVAIAIVAFTDKQLGYRGPTNAIGRSANAETAGA